MAAKLPATCKVIERPGERFRYWVESASEKGDAHTVDLTQNGGLGSCTCANYQFRIQGAQMNALGLAMQKRRPPQRIEWRPGEKREGCTECRHIWAAKRHFEIHHLMPFLAQFENGDPQDYKPALQGLLLWRDD